MSATPTHPQAAIRMASIDWLTATTKTAVGRDEYRRIAAVIAANEATQGNPAKVWGWQGYSGIQAGGLTHGERQDGAILRLSGPLAANHWRDAVRWSANVSRLDLQVTTHHKPFPSHLGTEGYAAILLSTPPGSKPPNANLTVSTDGGETLYLGRRASEKYARLYNKEAESKEAQYRHCWRYEIELKGKAANLAASKLLPIPDERPHVATYVWRHFSDRDVAPTFAPLLAGGLLSVPRSRSTDERALIWLATQVRAVVNRLTIAGRRPELLAALGL